MNNSRFLIIDDDYGICQVLSNIIEDNDLGDVVDTIQTGEDGIDLIGKYRPDIVFVDLLLPDIDGTEIVKQIKHKNHDIDFIMISQVSDVEMISEAYDHGIEFYINKPINVVEVISVTKKVINSQNNRRVIASIGNTIGSVNNSAAQHKSVGDKGKNINTRINGIFAELGIISDRGCSDLTRMVEIIYKDLQVKNKSNSSFSVGRLYVKISNEYKEEKNRKDISDKAVEQRIRRTVQSAFINTVKLGSEDFDNFKFEKYSSSLFDFSEIMKGIESNRKGKVIKGKVSVKSFVSGIITLLQQES